MEDAQIIGLYVDRSEAAISETDRKYGSYCYTISHNILGCREDAEETVSDTYLQTWNSIPPQNPPIFSAFLGRITRHLSIDRWRTARAQKRGGGEVPLALEELGDCVGQNRTPEDACLEAERNRAIRDFLADLPRTQRQVFLCRYFYLDSVTTIAGFTGFSVSKVSSMLHRTRQKLRDHLEKEGLL